MIPIPYLPEGHVLVTPPDLARGLGYWIAQDASGSEYVVGASRDVDADGGVDVRRMDVESGEIRTTHTFQGQTWRDLRPATTRDQMQAQVPQRYRADQAWSLPRSGVKLSPGQEKARDWMTKYLAGDLTGSLLVCGPPGSGKTQVTAWMVQAACDAGRGVLRVEWPQFVERLRNSYSSADARAEWQDALAEMRDVELLIVDDFASVFADKEDVRNAFFSVLDQRINDVASMVVTSNYPREAMALPPPKGIALDERIVSRFKVFREVVVAGQDFRSQR